MTITRAPHATNAVTPLATVQVEIEEEWSQPPVVEPQQVNVRDAPSQNMIEVRTHTDLHLNDMTEPRDGGHEGIRSDTIPALITNQGCSSGTAFDG